MKSLIANLTQIPGPAGHEALIREFIRAELAPIADEIRVDALGNLIVWRSPFGERHPQRVGASGLKIMLTAHMDEIGVMVIHIDKNGFARFIPVGTYDLQSLPGRRVQFLNGAVGVIGVEGLKSLGSRLAVEQLYLDFGVSKREDCPVGMGETAVFQSSFLELGERMVSKALDDRIGIAVLIETMRQIKFTPHQIFYVFSSQEEVGSRGVTPAAYEINPDLGLAIDVTSTGDMQQGYPREIHLGKGPAIKVRDAKMLSDARVVDWMGETAKKTRIPIQYEILEQASTDARAIQLTRAGVPAGGLLVPCRYIHTPSEMVDYNDVLDAIRLLLELLSHPIKL